MSNTGYWKKRILYLSIKTHNLYCDDINNILYLYSFCCHRQDQFIKELFSRYQFLLSELNEFGSVMAEVKDKLNSFSFIILSAVTSYIIIYIYIYLCGMHIINTRVYFSFHFILSKVLLTFVFVSTTSTQIDFVSRKLFL